MVPQSCRAGVCQGAKQPWGDGVGKNLKEGVRWYRKAAEQGLTQAQCVLGSFYREGEGVELDKKKAVIWYRKAAEQGDAEAQNNLGLAYHFGDGVVKDDVKALMWLVCAASNGIVAARKTSETLGRRMTNAQFVKAKALHNEMIKKNPKLIKKKE